MAIERPAGEPAERRKAEAAEGVYRHPLLKRPLPDLALRAPLPETLEYAFNANGELEGAYRDWRAALERVTQAGARPDPMLDFSAMFSTANLKNFNWDKLKTLTANLEIKQEMPRKEKLAARAAGELARTEAAGERFRAEKFKLQRDVIDAYARLALNGEFTAITSETLRLSRQSYEVASHRYHYMDEAPLTDLEKIEVETRRSESELRGLAAERAQTAAELNGILNRPPMAPLGPVALPRIEAPGASPAELLARVAARNPQLAALRKEIAAQGAEVTLAELQRKPDFTPKGSVGLAPLSPSWTGLDLSGGFEMNLPLNRERIRAAINEALATRRAMEARYRASEADAQARLLMALSQLADAERAERDFTRDIIPGAERVLTTQLDAYGAGNGDYLDILDTQRTLADMRRVTAQARANRLRALAELEQLAGDDLFQFAAARPEPPMKEAASPAAPAHD